MSEVSYSLGAFLNVTSENPQEWQSQLRRLRSLTGIGHVEVWLEIELTEQHVSQLRTELQGLRVAIHAPFVGLALASPWHQLAKISADRIRSCIQIAGRLRAEVLTLHSGPTPVFESRSEAFHRLVRVANGLIGEAEAFDLQLGFENMPARTGTSREPLSYLSDLADFGDATPNSRYTLDIGHATQNGDDWESFLRTYGERVVDVHVHDGVRGGPAHLSLGEGQLAVEKCSLFLGEMGYSNFVSLETIGWEDTKQSWGVWRATL